MIEECRRGPTAGTGTLVTSAVALISIAVIAAMWLVVRHGAEPAVDRDAFSLLQTSRRTFLGAHAGDLPRLGLVLTVLVGVGGVGLLAWRRRWLQAATITAGYPLILAVGYVLKVEIARPRPPAPVLVASGYSFPSTDAAASIAAIATAVALVGLTEDRRVRVALVGVATAAVVAVAALLIALRVHYLTDILAGWGLGVAGFSVAALCCQAIAAYGSSTRVSRASRRSH